MVEGVLSERSLFPEAIYAAQSYLQGFLLQATMSVVRLYLSENIPAPKIFLIPPPNMIQMYQTQILTSIHIIHSATRAKRSTPPGNSISPWKPHPMVQSDTSKLIIKGKRPPSIATPYEDEKPPNKVNKTNRYSPPPPLQDDTNPHRRAKDTKNGSRYQYPSPPPPARNTPFPI